MSIAKKQNKNKNQTKNNKHKKIKRTIVFLSKTFLQSEVKLIFLTCRLVLTQIE